MVTIISHQDLDVLFERTARTLFGYLLTRADERIIVGLPGGRSIVKFLTTFLSLRAELNQQTWQRLHFFLVDERLVPVDSADCNYRLLREVFFEPAISEDVLRSEQVHPFFYDPNRADFGYGDYQREFERCGGNFDVIVLGIGEDGHVASLFPRHPLLSSSRAEFSIIENSPKPPPRRITATSSMLLQAEFAIGILVGEEKRGVFDRYCSPDTTLNDCPAKLLNDIEESYLVTNLTSGGEDG